MRSVFALTCIGLAWVAVATPVHSAEERWDAGIRYSLNNGGGRPTADMQSVGAFGHYAWAPRWRVGFAIDRQEFDFEGPLDYVGLQQDSSVATIDSKVSGYIFRGWADWVFRDPARKLRWFVGGGLGVAALSAKRVRGPIQGGGSFDLTTDTGTDLVLSAAGGLDYNFARHWRLEAAVRFDEFFANWDLRETGTGATGSVGSFSAPGGYVGVTYRF